MNINTALTPKSTKALLLGSGELGKEVAISLQRYGIEVIAIDSYPNAPAHQVAHRAHVMDMTNAEQLHALIALEQPDFIIPEIEAIATEALATIEALGNSTVVPNARAVQLTMNREGIRTLAAETLNLPTSEYAFADNFKALKTAIVNKIGYPCFIKPTMSSSGKGQSMVKTPSELEAAWNIAQTCGRNNTGKVIVEAKIDFDFEITLLTVRALNSEGIVTTYFCEPIGHRQEDGDYRESWQPQVMSELSLQKSQYIAQVVTENIGGLGLFGVELFIQGDEVWFSEVSPRPHDTGMVTMVTQRQSEFDLHVRAILGLPVSTKLESAGASAVILSQINSKDMQYSGLAQALAIDNTEIRLFSKPEARPNRRMGVALNSAETIEIAKINAKLASERIKITSSTSGD